MSIVGVTRATGIVVVCGHEVCRACPTFDGELDGTDRLHSTKNDLWHLFWTSGEAFWTSDMNRERDGPTVNMCSSVVCVHSTCNRPELAYGFYVAYSIRLKAFIERGAIWPLTAPLPLSI